MTRRAFVLSLAASTALADRTQSAGTPKERGRSLVEKTIEGLGGDAFRTMSNCVETGRAFSFYRDNLKGLAPATIYTRYLEPGAATAQSGLRQLQREVLGKPKEEDTALFIANEAWEVTFRGARPLGEERFNRYRESTLLDIFYILRERVAEPGMEFEFAGSDVVENQPVQTLRIYDAEDRQLTVWVNSDTFLPVKQRYTHWDSTINERREEVSWFAKYRDAGGGVMWPFTIQRDRDTEKVFQMYSETVTVNAPLASSLFELPDGIRKLKP